MSMSVPQPHHPTQSPQPAAQARRSGLLRGALWVAIVAIILAAIVCVVWVLVGPDNDIIGRAFLTILLLAGFAGAAILDAGLADRRPPWLALTSMVVWVVILLIGAFLIWMPERFSSYWLGFESVGRFGAFLLIVAIMQGALLHVRLFVRAHRRHVTGFTTAITIVTIALVAVLTIMLVLPLTFHEFLDFPDLYWRFVVAVTILAAVGTALVPLINALFAPKRPRPVARPAAYAPAPWPTYADGATPLPVLPDGSPDWNAYATGYPTYPQGAPQWPQQGAPQWPQSAAPAPYPGASPHPGAPNHPAPPQPAAPAARDQPAAPQVPPTQPGYQGYPPPPPAPR